MMEKDEADTLSRLFALRTQLVEPAVASGGGKIVKTTGDGVLAEFLSAVRAVEAALAIQKGLDKWPDIGEPLQLRIGIHIGDVIARGDDIFGDGVNIAARLEQAADPGGVLVSSAVYDQVASHFPDVFSDAGEQELKNISRRIRAWTTSGASPRLPSPADEKPSIAVLPFESLSQDSDQEYLAHGIVEDLISSLSRFHWFRVTPRVSALTVHDPESAGATLGVRYVLEGTVRRSGSRIRVSAHLVDLGVSTTIWADRFDRRLEDLFDLQDEMVQAIVGAVVPEFVASFQPGRPRTSISSWELAMRGWNMVTRLDGSGEAVLGAREMFQEALADDENNTLALSGLAYSFSNPYYQTGTERDVRAAVETARRAIETDGRDAFAWCLLGVARFYANEFGEAERCLRRSIAINRSLSLAHVYMAFVYAFRGAVDEADKWAESATRLSPADPLLPMLFQARAMSRFVIEDYQGAVDLSNQTLAVVPDFQSAWRMKAATLEMMGDHEKAAEAVEHLLALGPVTMEWARRELTPTQDPEAWSLYLDALSRAGVPEET